ncbi:LacI family DNA-binding transcriptional regulator [Jannaschia donghaensis]|uniref:Gluconate utilization system GNT-I transcriptional repressor n=1 Tax=Jannaschia donghaensis TaxID=420998 RepID=A0A0M6YNH7_9RHOB|nr:LacI family DNA-binding transcriptional regulator [Jannaschia donghaensis]CTQ51195.1 Gluconate utilization system GNT-I transcriptional repressor [Jannaschia donghaensis]
MRRTPTMKDVARAAGVSVMTVSRAFKRDTSVGEETRKRIHAAADDLGYVFDSMAANLRSQRSHFVAVTIPSLNNANFAATVEAMTARLGAAGYQVLLGHTGYDILREEELIAEFLSRRPEAVIVTGGRHTPRARSLLSNAGVPVVETWDLPDDPIGHVVGFSNAACMDLLVDHLAGQGYVRIAFIGGDAGGDTRGADRRRGFVAAMQARGLDATRLIRAGQPPISMHEGAAAMAYLLDKAPDTEAVICVSDLSAFGALTECQRRGVSVPDDIAIAGFGAYDIAGICVPTLTTVDPCPAQIGDRAADLVLTLIETPGGPAVARIEPVLKIGQSTTRDP